MYLKNKKKSSVHRCFSVAEILYVKLRCLSFIHFCQNSKTLESRLAELETEIRDYSDNCIAEGFKDTEKGSADLKRFAFIQILSDNHNASGMNMQIHKISE